jgi:hemoglobin
MHQDVSNNEDIRVILLAFHQRIKTDPLIGFFFSDVIHLNWDYHLQRMHLFWENVIFHTGEYEGSPIKTHRYVNELHATRSEHFQRWLLLFEECINGLYAGPNAEKMKQHARSIADIMMQNIVK